ncbi:MAG: two pore domain potassium channel family protein [Pseudomonadales bacterium]|nr:two pore domain potassium channel family protein [Pseudomonadales bacterium]
MLLAIGIALVLVLITFSFHYRILLWIGSSSFKLKFLPQTQVLGIVIVLFFVHVVEIGFYGIAYYVSVEWLGLGSFSGALTNEPMSYLYYSGVIFTSLGLGDIYPQGHVRFITAIETLNGLLLITWTASFTFLAMSRLWHWNDGCCGTEDKENKL